MTAQPRHDAPREGANLCELSSIALNARTLGGVGVGAVGEGVCLCAHGETIAGARADEQQAEGQDA